MKRKILFIKRGLDIGGTTTSFIALLDSLRNQDKYEIFVWTDDADKAKNILPSSVKVISNSGLEDVFGSKGGTLNKLIDLFRYRQLMLYTRSKLISRKDKTDRRLISVYQQMDVNKAKRQKTVDLTEYDAVITWEELYPCYALAECIKAKKKIAWIHPDYLQCGFKAKFDIASFKKLDRIVAVSEKGKESLCKALPEMTSKFCSIENCVNVTQIKEKSALSQNEIVPKSDRINLVTVARLQNISKAYDRAVNIAARLRDNGLDFVWYFIGDGEDRQQISQQIEELGLGDYVYVLGAKQNPYPYMKAADLFVLQSYYEGKPMVVDEAMIIGTPVLVTDYAAAQSQVKKEYGWIVENREDAIFEKLRELIADRKLLQEKRSALISMSLEKYTSCAQFISMLEEVL